MQPAPPGRGERARPGGPRVRPLEMWGGVECSVVRVGDTWRDQLHDTGHHDRGLADLDRLAALGLRTLRYPVLWERCAPGRQDAPGGGGRQDAPGGAGRQDAPGWAWHDRQLGGLQERGIGVVAGLVHHGSGPPGTSLLDPLFPEKLAVHADAAAARYPFVAAWTPVNEPLTTARFACLYGHWYPHHHDEDSFLRALVVQVRAALLAMRAIRRRLPGARFVHTEDVGRVFSTPDLRAQAEYENGRRWLSLDLLCGRLDRRHPWRRRLEACGVPAAQLDELATGEAAPDLIGVNHYVTSDRFLDGRVALYPQALHGGNGRQAYADTEAARVALGEGATGWAPRLREVWARYGLPMAVTEAHLGCEDPREQLRWLMEAWDAALALRAEGADLRAVTAWALFGLVDWDIMLRERRGRHEAGALTTAAMLPARAPRALASAAPAPAVLTRSLLPEAIAALARTGHYAHPALHEPGWWRREERVHAALPAL